MNSLFLRIAPANNFNFLLFGDRIEVASFHMLIKCIFIQFHVINTHPNTVLLLIQMETKYKPFLLQEFSGSSSLRNSSTLEKR